MSKQLEEKLHLLFCRFWFPRMFTISVQPETKILFNFPSLQLFMKNIKLRNKGFSLGRKNECLFFHLSNIKWFFTSNGDNFKRKCCDSIILLGKPFFFPVCSCVNNLKVSNFQNKLFFAYKNCHQVSLCQDAAPNPEAKTRREWIDVHILMGVKDNTFKEQCSGSSA